MRAMGFRGGNVAEPHKQAILPMLDRVTDTAALAGGVNLILREEDALVGENTEGKGVVQSLRRLTDPAGKHVVILGAGRMAEPQRQNWRSRGYRNLHRQPHRVAAA